MLAMGERHDGVMGLFIGVSRSGKSLPLMCMVEKAPRVLIWDAKAEYGVRFGLDVFRDVSALLQRLKTATGNARIAYIPTGSNARKEFDLFCRMAHTWNRLKPAMIVAEELAAVTHAGKADGGWNTLVNQGLGLGMTLLATVQRGQEVDKSIMNNASYLYICKHNTQSDAEYIADKLGVAIHDIPREKLRFIKWTSDKGIIARGRVKFSGKTYYWQNGKPIFYDANNRNKIYKPLPNGMMTGINYR